MSAEKIQSFELLRLWLLKHKAIDTSVQGVCDIKRLDLSGCLLESLPDDICLLTDLVFLNLSNNSLSALPSSMGALIKLNNLDIRRNKFVSLPEVIKELNLGSLNASANKISDVSLLLDCLELRVCDLSFNNLSGLGRGFAKGNTLRTLNLSGNFFKEVPEIEHLRELQRLNLSGNMLSELSSRVSVLKELVDLNLSDNEIVKIDEGLFSLPLEELELSANSLRSLVLSGLEDLEHLSLDENPLSVITVKDGFAPYLQEFSCDSCELESFVALTSTHLESLCLSSNKISMVPDDISKYSNLTQLDIDNNMIKDLPYDMTNMTRLQTLYITGNPLNENAKEVIKILHPDICDMNMKTGISVEKAGENDLTQMAELIGILFEIEKDFSVDFEKQLAGITKLYTHEDTDLLVARHEGKVIGMVTMQRLISSAAGDYIGQIEDLVVHEQYRKMGVGSRLINKIRFVALEEHGYKRVQLAADMDNVNALNFYTRRGFRRTNLNVFHLTK